MTADRSIPADGVCIYLLRQTRERVYNILPVLVIFKYRFAVDPSNDDMIKGVGGIYAGFAGHGGFIQITELL
jgi:hypothetical protein